MLKTFAAIVLVGGLALTGCSSDESTEDANAAYCNQLATTLVSIQALSDLDPTTATIDDYNAARDAVAANVEQLDAAAEDVAEAAKSDAESAVDSYQSTIESIPGDATAQDALASAISAAVNLNGQLEAVSTQIGC